MRLLAVPLIGVGNPGIAPPSANGFNLIGGHSGRHMSDFGMPDVSFADGSTTSARPSLSMNTSEPNGAANPHRRVASSNFHQAPNWRLWNAIHAWARRRSGCFHIWQRVVADCFLSDVGMSSRNVHNFTNQKQRFTSSWLTRCVSRIGTVGPG